ncbi:MAG: N-acetylmuramoyl-L-alanine amidase [Myxococcales bacterium]|nr:N-acetylmuramoyl-L-alanine amidase [Myxococcales bacterium]
MPMHGLMVGASLLAQILAGPAGDAVVDAPLAAEDGHDDHTRPPLYDDLDALLQQWAPIYAGNAEYPRAVGFVPADSSNYSQGGINPEFIVVHTMQGYYAGSMSWFQNPAANVSAHFVMRASDGEVTQMVKLNDKAWHVGNYNGKCLGIEHEGWVDEPDEWYTWAAYTSSAMLTRWMADRHGIALDRDHIIGHVEVPGASHTDPGPGWNWDLYMALIHELVSEREIVGVVVDASAACTLTASGDTWVTRTLQTPGELGNNDKCLVSAGAQLEYHWAEVERIGRRRLTLAPGGPCDALGERAYVEVSAFNGFCAPEDMVVGAGTEVRLDGGASTFTDAAGAFSFADIAAGAHTVDVLEDAEFFAAAVPLQLEATPGARVIAVVEPVPVDDTDGDPTDTGDPTDPTADPTDPTSDPTADPTDPTGDPTNPTGDPTSDPTDPTGDPSGSTGDGDSSDAGGDPGDSGGGSNGGGGTDSAGALPNDYGGDAAYPEGCGCRSANSRELPGLLVLLLAATRRRRRRR